MKLVMTLLVRDEEDILRHHLEFHLSRGVDQFIVMDNLSEDFTREILLPYERAGMVTYMFQPRDDYAQAMWVTEMARMAATQFNADWIINSDADEFWWPNEGTLKNVLSEVPEQFEAVRVDRTNFVPPRLAGAEPFLSAMTIREVKSLNALGQPLPPKVCHRAFNDITVLQGNHDAQRLGRSVVTTQAPISILHFPVRSYSQFSNKVAKGGAAYARNSALPPQVGATWRRLYELQRERQLRPVFDRMALSDEEIEEGLRAGRLVRDVRLRDALERLRQQSRA